MSISCVEKRKRKKYREKNIFRIFLLVLFSIFLMIFFKK